MRPPPRFESQGRALSVTADLIVLYNPKRPNQALKMMLRMRPIALH